MTTMNLWCTTDAGCADTETSRNMSQCQRVLGWKECDLKSSFHLLWLLHGSTGFKQLMSMANTESYRRSQVCPRTFYCLFFFVVVVVVNVGPDCQFVCQPNCTWNRKSPQLRSYCVFTENFNKTSLINFCFHSKCWHFKFFSPVNTCKLCGRVISGE